MLEETQIPLAALVVNGTCEDTHTAEPIDLITIEYSNRVPSSE
jgi:hypothetical protein